MLPRSGRRPLELGETSPKWLAHQREVNHLVASVVTSSSSRVVWASTWDSPFPSRAGTIPLPQPDYVLVEEAGGVPRLIFGEHDRGTEPLVRFSERKIELYSTLAAFPEVCEAEFGIRTFRVAVSVVDPMRRAPIARLRSLIDASRRVEGAEMFRFTLGGWMFAYPTDSIWFSVNFPPTNESSAMDDHACALQHF
jgi:hypothetical protein